MLGRISDYQWRWLVIAAIAVVDVIAFAALGVSIDTIWIADKLPPIAVLLALAGTYAWLGTRFPKFDRVLGCTTDLLLSFLQLFVLIEVCVPLTYATAATNFPLIDTALLRVDTALGFDWDAVARWVHARRSAELVLQLAYDSTWVQAITLMLVMAITRRGERASEMLWLSIVTMLLTTIVAIWTPAMAHVGTIGARHLEVFQQLRAGQWSSFDLRNGEGIVQFPSFHTTLALMLTYLARRHNWLLAVLVPLNILMLLSVPPVGGHYLADMFGGIAVFGAAVAIMRSYLSPNQAEAHSPAARPLEKHPCSR